MKNWVLLFMVLMSIGGYTQSTENPCSNIPLAKPQIKAVCELPLLAKSIQSNLDEVYKKNSFDADFKLIVDCKGFVSKVTYQQGNLIQDKMSKILEAFEQSVWIPAKDEGKSVTSTTFLKLKITNGKVEVSVF